MVRCWLFVLAACGATSKDDRPLELDYLTSAIFAPTCGATQCHSTFKQARGLVFDHPEATRRSLISNGLIRFDCCDDQHPQSDADSPGTSDLIIWITEIDPFGLGIGRMPFDAPMPNKDVALLEEWIANEAPGAQCNPAADNGLACNNRTVLLCNADWSFGDPVQSCSGDCSRGLCQ